MSKAVGDQLISSRKLFILEKNTEASVIHDLILNIKCEEVMVDMMKRNIINQSSVQSENFIHLISRYI